MALAHAGVILGVAGVAGGFVIGLFSLIFTAGAVVFAPALLLLGPFGAAIAIIAGGLSFSALAFAAVIPVLSTVFILYIGKWLYIGVRDYVILPIFSPAESTDEVYVPGSKSTRAVIEEQDAGAVVEAIDCEYEPDHPSCPRQRQDEEEEEEPDFDDVEPEQQDEVEVD